MTDIDTLTLVVAREVMDWQGVTIRQTTGDDRYVVYSAPDYPRDIAAAWQVVDMMTVANDRISAAMVARFRDWWADARLCDFTAEDAAEQICRAAVAIVRGEK